MNDLRRLLPITHFSMIDGAMIRVVRAAGSYEKAIYTVDERVALERLVKAAVELKDVFVKVAKHINEGEIEIYQVEEKA